MVMPATRLSGATCAWSLALSFAAACGARSELELGLAEGGSDASGGGGEAPPSCVLTQLPGEVTLAGGEESNQRVPSLQHDLLNSNPEIGVVSLVHLVSEAPWEDEFLTGELFSPWPSWPPTETLMPPLPGLPAVTSYVNDSGFALIADQEATPFFAGIFQPDFTVQLAVGAATPAFIRGGETGGWFGGFTIAADSQLYLISVNEQLQYDFRLDWGCGSTPVRATAIPWGDDYLVALTSGADFGGCGIPGGAGPSTRLQIARFNTSFEGELLYETDLGRTVQTLTLSPRDGGAWLGVRERDGETATTIDVYRLGADGAPIGEPASIDPHGGASTLSAFDAEPMGERLAVSYREQITSDLTIQLVEADGRLGASAALHGDDNGDTSVLGRGDSVILAYTAMGALGQIHVARFDCVAP